MSVSRRLAVAALLAFAAPCVSAQSIFTVAGGGTLDGQLASSIPTSGPRGIAFDRSGNIYLAVRYGGQVLKIDAVSGVVKVVAGNGASGYSGDGDLATGATLRQPGGIVLDADDNLYIADTDNGRIRRVDAKSGIITTYAGGATPASGNGDGGQATAAELDQPWGLTIDRGFLYITEQAYNAHNVRRVNMATGIIDTIAGTTDGSRGGFGGDNGPAKAAQLDTPFGIVADASGNLYIADTGNSRVRRIDTNGNITTYAGGGAAGNIADGVQATQADLGSVTVLAFDSAGNLLVSTGRQIRRVDKDTHVITTVVDGTGLLYGLAVAKDGTIYFSDDGYGRVFTFAPGATEQVVFAGNGTYVGDGRAAKAAVLHSPEGLAADAAGNVYIADSAGNIVRRVSAADGTISTVAGTVNGIYAPPQEGIDATQAAVGFPLDVAFDPGGNLYIADALNERIWRVDSAGKITTYAGGGSPADGVGDNGPATAANIIPLGITFDRSGNLYIADSDQYATIPHARVRRVDAVTKTITTFAGSDKAGYAGDGGPARAAQLDQPFGVAVDNDGSVLISENGNGTIRRVDGSGTITTIAGSPTRNEGDPLGDEGPASAARITPLHMAFNRATGDLIIADHSSHRVRRIDKQGFIHTVAGSDHFYYEGGFAGDNGPATAAKLSFDYGDTSGIAISAAGDVYLSDSQNNRVRAVFACVTVAAPQLTAVADGLAAPRLAWSSVAGAFRYDVRLDTITPPARVIASDLTETSFSPANLQPGTKYFWSVTAKGDSFCPTVSTAASAISSFTTATGCGAGSFELIAPADGAQNVDAPTLQLSWQAAPGAGTYDVYYGPTSPPPLVASGIQQTSYAPAPIARAFWFVVAHAACDPAKTSATPMRSFTTNLSTGCAGVPTVTLTSPAAGSVDVPASVDLQWSVSGGSVDTFDVYFGTTSDPTLLRSNVAGNARSLSLSQLTAGTTYFWRLVSRSTCFAGGSASTPVASFTTHADCTPPGATTILFAPASVSAGATYTIVWSSAPGLDAGGGYLVERSTSSSFASILDSQVSSSTAASFVAGAPGTYYHRVRALPACDPTKSGPVSAPASVNAVNAPANVIFTVQPQAVVTALGEKIEDRNGSFTIENIGAAPAQIIVGQSELPGSRPFFSIAEGGAFVTLQPRVPRTFTIQYSGPPNDTAGSYQGVIFAVGVTQPLPVTPYAFVNLKVGGGPAVAPQFVVDGAPGEYAAFPGFSGDDDSNRPAREISIRNPGTAPVELAAEIGPEVWLVPENGWNAQPLAAGATRTVKLFTRRPFAPSGSPLPRYTYFTVRTKDGATARLLVQDNDLLAVSSGRATALEVGARSFIVPDAVNRLRLTNNGGDSVQAEMIFTPSGADGFDAAAVKRAVVLVPPNDVVTFTDPIVQVFGAAAGTIGQIEIRIPRERLGLIAVTAGVPVVPRGTGARIGAPHVIYISVPAATTLALAETSGADHAGVRVIADGQTTTADIPRYGMQRITLGAPSRIEIDVDSGGGSVIALAKMGNATFISSALNDSPAAKLGKGALAGIPSVTTVIPVISGVSSAGAAPSLKTAIGLLAQSSSATFVATFYPSTGSVALNRSVSVAAGQTTIFNDVMRDLFGATTPSDGNLFVQAPPNGKVYAVLQTAASGGASVPSSAVPLPTTLSEALTSATGSSQRPLSYDGLEQSVDPTRGSRWLLLLNEMGGGPGFVNVRLYEAGNRSVPIAEGDLAIAANQQVKLDTVFSTLGLDTPERRKDRTNVEVVVTATAGTASIAASAVSIDNVTGDTRMVSLTPAVGSGNPSISFVTPVINAPTAPNRHRVAAH